MRRARLIPFFLCALGAPATVCAQWDLRADAGVSHLRQAGIPEANAQTLGATFDAAGERSVFRTSFLAARAASESWTGQGLLVGSIVGPTASAARWQVDGVVSAFGETSELPTTSAELAARARIGSSLRGGAIGAGIGANSRGATRNPLYRAQGDAWWSIAEERLVVSVALTRARSLFVASTAQATSPTLSYVDVAATWRHDAGSLSFGAGAGVRGENGASNTRTNAWGVVDAATWLAPQLALVFGAGRTLDDVARGVPHASFVSFAVRIAAQSHTPIFARRSPRTGPRISAERVSDGVGRIDVRVDGASRIELMADFTNWSPVTLDRVGDVWRLERAIPAGAHRVAIRVDGGPWIVPANLPRVEDDLAGVVGIITVP